MRRDLERYLTATKGTANQRGIIYYTHTSIHMYNIYIYIYIYILQTHISYNMGRTHYTRMSSRAHTLTHSGAVDLCERNSLGWPLIGRYYDRLFHLITCSFPWIRLGCIIKGHPAHLYPSRPPPTNAPVSFS